MFYYMKTFMKRVSGVTKCFLYFYEFEFNNKNGGKKRKKTVPFTNLSNRSSDVAVE